MTLKCRLGAALLITLTATSPLAACANSDEIAEDLGTTYAVQRACAPDLVVLTDTDCPRDGWLYMPRSTWRHNSFALGATIPATIADWKRPTARDKTIYLYDLAGTRIATIAPAPQPNPTTSRRPRATVATAGSHPSASPTRRQADTAPKQTTSKRAQPARSSKTSAPTAKSTPRAAKDTTASQHTSTTQHTTTARRASGRRGGHR